MTLKEHFQILLANNQIEKAIEDAMDNIDRESSLFEELIFFSGKWKSIQSSIRTGRFTNEEGAQERDTLSLKLSDFAKEIPDGIEIIEKPNLSETKEVKQLPAGILEESFKWHIFLGLILVKGFLLTYIYFIKDTGGMLTRDYLTINGLLLPVFAASLIIMIKHLFPRRNMIKNEMGPRVNRGIQFFAYTALFIYGISIFMAVNSFSSEEADIQGLLNWINITEASLGAALGYIISTLFKEELISRP